MTITLESFNDRVAVRLETRYARARLIAADALPAGDGDISKPFTQAMLRWRQEGYSEEDAATLALFEITVKHRGSTLTDATSFPRLIDDGLSLQAHEDRLAGHSFALMQDPQPGIYPIVDRLELLETLLIAGARIIQLRIKSDQLTPEIDRSVAKAVELSKSFPQSQLFINDYWQSALAHGAYGVHLGQEDLLTADLAGIRQAGLRLGVSSHAYWEVARALTIAPSYIACGPIFPTRAKVMPWIPQGIDNLAYWAALIPHPVIGIGGIHADNLDQVRGTGCAGASVIQAIASDPDPAAAYQTLQRRWQDGNPSAPHQSDLASPARIARPTLPPQPGD